MRKRLNEVFFSKISGHRTRCESEVDLRAQRSSSNKALGALDSSSFKNCGASQNRNAMQTVCNFASEGRDSNMFIMLQGQAAGVAGVRLKIVKFSGRQLPA